nr:hypothetical protein BaRGS_015790 [Batillaria attramentaria]
MAQASELACLLAALLVVAATPISAESLCTQDSDCDDHKDNDAFHDDNDDDYDDEDDDAHDIHNTVMTVLTVVVVVVVVVVIFM